MGALLEKRNWWKSNRGIGRISSLYIEVKLFQFYYSFTTSFNLLVRGASLSSKSFFKRVLAWFLLLFLVHFILYCAFPQSAFITEHIAIEIDYKPVLSHS